MNHFEPEGIALTIEQALEKLGMQAQSLRSGKNQWQIKRGSALITISYHSDTGLISGDALLCRLPETNDEPLLRHLLKENTILKGLVLSVKGRDVLLTLTIYDRHFDLDSAKVLFSQLFEKADDYDDEFIEGFGAYHIE